MRYNIPKDLIGQFDRAYLGARKAKVFPYPWVIKDALLQRGIRVTMEVDPDPEQTIIHVKSEPEREVTHE